MTSVTPQPSSIAPLSEADIRKLAAQRVADSMGAQGSQITATRLAAAAKSSANQAALRGLGDANASLLGGIGQGIQQGYSNAAAQIGGLAGGFSSAAADRVRAAQAANDAFVQSQAPGASSQQVASPDSLQNSLYGMQGFSPASSLAEQGASARTWAEALPAIQQAQTTGAVGAEMSRSATQDTQYAQQLIDLAATQPHLQSQALDELYKHELDKLNARLSLDNAATQKEQFAATQKQGHEQFAATNTEAIRQFNLTFGENKDARDQTQNHWLKTFAQSVNQNNVAQGNANRTFNLTSAQWAAQIVKNGQEHDLALRGMTVQEAAEKLYEQQFGQVTVPKAQADIAQGWETLKIQAQQIGISAMNAQTAFQRATLTGQEFDPGLSKALHYAVDKSRQPILQANGGRIPMPTKAAGDPAALAVREAAKLLGRPIENPNVGTPNFVGQQGKYLAAPGATNTFPADQSLGLPPTTNDPSKAKTEKTRTFTQAQAYLVGLYPTLTRAQARKALVASGWKPDGVRPKGK